jgi:hypothetical protein
MSYAIDVRFKHYMVELDDGRTIHVGDEDVEGVKHYISQRYALSKIKTIYLEVFSGETDEEENN